MMIMMIGLMKKICSFREREKGERTNHFLWNVIMIVYVRGYVVLLLKQ